MTAVGRSSMSAIQNASSGSGETKLIEGTTVFCSGEMGMVHCFISVLCNSLISRHQQGFG